jgi:hypothetical protein
MALNLELLAGLVKVYGTPLYGAISVQDAGTLDNTEYELIDGNVLYVDNDGRPMYIPIRGSVVDAGFDADRIFTIGTFVAERDANGERDGVAWSVTKGARKVFAY